MHQPVGTSWVCRTLPYQPGANRPRKQQQLVMTEDQGTTLLDLPHSVTLLILQQLDVVSLCSTSRCCRVLHRLCGHPSLWPAHYPASEWALGDVRATLAALLHLPPQVRAPNS